MRARLRSLSASIALLFPAIATAQPAPAPRAPAPAPPPPAPAPPPPPSAPSPPPPAASSQLPVFNAEPAPAPAPPPPANPPGYYVEQVPPAPGQPRVYEPPPPGGVYEPPPPPPPPTPRHVAPRNALWLGARVGWFFPFGSAYAAGSPDPYSGVVYLHSVPWTDFVHSGPALELDAGVRLARNYNIFGVWERAFLTSGSSNLYGNPSGGDSDYFALGLRATSDADRIGVLTELSLGYRQARARYEGGDQVEMTGGILEGRIGVGLDLRLSPLFSLAPIVAIGVGSFDRVQYVFGSGGSVDLIKGYDTPGSHGWVTVGVGGSVDLFGAE
ncbi:MAG TPA: hypothetical protein VFV94_06080 [Polyangiaceae bacterium]|nr:hypothetical protein [Polyangiaceae bacterium]